WTEKGMELGPAAINQIKDELQFVHALEVRDFRLITRLDERVEACLDQLADAAAKDGLLAEQVGLGFFRECCFQNTGARTTKSLGICKRLCLRVAACILLDGDQRGRAAAFGEDFAYAMARRFRRNHRNINVGGRLDRAEANVEAVRKHERLSFVQMRRNRIPI